MAPLRTRKDLVRWIAGAVRAHLLSVNEPMALARPDAVLQRMAAAGLTIRRKRRTGRRR